MSEDRDTMEQARPARPIDLVAIAITQLENRASPTRESALALHHLRAALNELQGLMEDE